MPQFYQNDPCRQPHLIQDLIRQLAADLGLVNAMLVLVIHNRQLAKVKIKIGGSWKRQVGDAEPGPGIDADHAAAAIRRAVQPNESFCPTVFARWSFKIAKKKLAQTCVKIALRPNEEKNNYALVWPCPN
jgi:hypothetical protein